MATRDEPILKRFANLDIDGVPKKKRPRRGGDPGAAAAVAATPTAPRRAPQLNRMDARTPPPMPPPQARRPAPPTRRPYPTPEWIGAPSRTRSAHLEVPPGAMPGVLTIEMDLRAPSRDTPPPATNQLSPPSLTDHRPSFTREATRVPRMPSPAPPPQRSYRRPPPMAGLSNTPPPSSIELTEIAARQIRLMAYQHGMTGAALRVMTSGAGGATDCDFAFEHRPEPEDIVLLSQGIRLLIDPRSLETLRGTRITYQDLPGAEGFRIG